MEKPPKTFFKLEDFVPSLREQIERQPLDLNKVIRAAIPVEDPEKHGAIVPANFDRQSIHLTDGTNFCPWEVESLQSLFRGDKQPPILGAYPEAYNESFLLLDSHVLQIAQLVKVPRDEEMKEIYSILRRRPDGRSLGFDHDYMWQAAAIVLGTSPLSKAEFEAIMSRLERSCRTFSRGPTSRNYVATLQSTIGQAF